MTEVGIERERIIANRSEVFFYRTVVDNVVIVHLSNFLIGWPGGRVVLRGVNVDRFSDLG